MNDLIPVEQVLTHVSQSGGVRRFPEEAVEDDVLDPEVARKLKRELLREVGGPDHELPDPTSRRLVRAGHLHLL